MAIFLDYNSTSPVDPRVIEAMRPYFQEHYGNPSSPHQYGRMAGRAIEKSRDQIASLFRVNANEIVFTSGGTEANNLALIGPFQCSQKRHIITAPTEHKSVLEPLEQIGRAHRAELTYLSVDSQGEIDLDQLKQSIRMGHTLLVSLM